MQKQVSRGVGVDLMTLIDIQISGWLEQPGAEPDGLVVRRAWVVDVVVEMHLFGGIPCGHSGGRWFGASCTPTRYPPAASLTISHALSSKT